MKEKVSDIEQGEFEENEDATIEGESGVMKPERREYEEKENDDGDGDELKATEIGRFLVMHERKDFLMGEGTSNEMRWEVEA